MRANAFGNALGNAAIAGINHYGAEQQLAAKQADQPTVFDMLGQAAQSDPKLAYMLGPYGSQYDDGGISDQALADYEASGLPMLASSDAASTEAGVHGPAGTDLMQTLRDLKPQMDSLRDRADPGAWSQTAQAIDNATGEVFYGADDAPEAVDNAVAQVQQLSQNAGGSDSSTDYLVAQGYSLTTGDQGVGGAQGGNTFSFLAGANSPTSVQTYLSQFGYGQSSEFNISNGVDPQLQAMASKGQNTATMPATEGLDTAKTGFDWTSTAADAGSVVTGALGKTWAFNWANPSIYDSIVVENGGWAPSWLANPKVDVNVAQSADAARDADYLVDLSKWGKAAPWLEKGGIVLGGLGVGAEFVGGVVNKDPAEIGHSVVGGAVWGVSSFVLTPIGGLVVGLAWTGLDSLAQGYTYNGQKGWTAIWHSAWDAQDQMQREDPKFYQQLWSQPKE